ncbi:MAG: LmbE family protein, partial [Gemmatimonadales bacterium]
VADVRYAAGRRIGYVRGAADEVPEALAGFGVGVELLDRQALESGDLSRFDAIIVGSRAYEVEPALAANNGRLLDYVRGGGHLLVQYQQQAFFQDGLAPYPMTVAAPHDRITDETAPVRVLHPDDPVWAGPNRIGAMDWSGWVQERGLYFAHTWDPHFRPLIESNDPGEAPLAGGLLLADYGEGTYLYTGLSFFRQLRAGVPGAFRLFLNLLSIGSRVAVP